MTKLEEHLQEALQIVGEKYEHLKEEAISLQSCMVLNSAYCDRLRHQLQAQEESRKKKMNNRLMGDGNPILLTSADFVRKVEEYTKNVEERENAAQGRREERAEIAKMKQQWDELNKERLEKNEKRKAQFQEDCKIWDENKRRKVSQGARPKWRDYFIPQLPKPWEKNGKGKELEKESGNRDSGSDSSDDE
ncbi:hypothetical protein K435DRAFT_662679 [Dendrothele bispora CBS 962.96]|uniref:Uncharacterized protein n=1 Tax=Dendrothele bispora (strain CBS 962.96) TaxID=1314807 RepID=A0A4S8M6S8_DENBC|nr:hypothetical protein K435DRAFT_662679 [Dendrothele bispora CBS 962.96]